MGAGPDRAREPELAAVAGNKWQSLVSTGSFLSSSSSSGSRRRRARQTAGAVRSMLEKQESPDAATWAHAVHSLRSRGRFQDDQLAFHLIKSTAAGALPVDACNEALMAAAQQQDWVALEATLGATLALGTRPEEVLIAHACGEGKPYPSPATVLQHLAASGGLAHVALLDWTPEICCQPPLSTAHLAFALTLADVLQEEGEEPSADTCAALAQGHFAAHAHELIARMGRQRWGNAQFGFAALIAAHAYSGQLREARALLMKMRGAGLQPSGSTYSALILAAAGDESLEDLTAVLEEAVEDDVALEEEAYEAALGAHAVSLIRRMLGALPNTRVLGDVILELLVGLRKESMWRPAMDVFMHVRDAGLLRTPEGCGLLVSLLMWCQKSELVIQVYGDMLLNKVEADARLLKMVRSAYERLGVNDKVRNVDRVLSWRAAGGGACGNWRAKASSLYEQRSRALRFRRALSWRRPTADLDYQVVSADDLIDFAKGVPQKQVDQRAFAFDRFEKKLQSIGRDDSSRGRAG
eukprot:jgi/Mesen1/354/ME000001S02664